MGVVVDLFTGQQVPAANGSGFVHDFIENELGEFLGALEALHDAETEEEFRRWLGDLKYQVSRWSI